MRDNMYHSANQEKCGQCLNHVVSAPDITYK